MRKEVGVPDQVRERVRLAPIKDVVRVRARLVRVRRRFVAVDVDQFVRLGDGQRAEQNGVDDAEDRAVDADAEGEREQRDQREAGSLPEAPHGVADVLRQGFHSASYGTMANWFPIL